VRPEWVNPHPNCVPYYDVYNNQTEEGHFDVRAAREAVLLHPNLKYELRNGVRIFKKLEVRFT